MRREGVMIAQRQCTYEVIHRYVITPIVKHAARPACNAILTASRMPHQSILIHDSITDFCMDYRGDLSGMTLPVDICTQ